MTQIMALFTQCLLKPEYNCSILQVQRNYIVSLRHIHIPTVSETCLLKNGSFAFHLPFLFPSLCQHGFTFL
ncbi:hypothetical protein EUGRSUZ_H00150 [Eucalyptus grandis]|uniref:Uncharacterized protein n=2 Tax=Eucalyptus grandis TaxID=71139 RepID=A0ACC3JL97_EUCGR|nr:hypothetical protein EUGRSUZ_H00150 [Eucalyptus grandis]